MDILILILITMVKIVGFTFVLTLPIIAYSVYAERRFSAILQDRVGPNRTGIPLTLFGFKKDIPLQGLLQPLADGLKFILKEDFTPSHVNKFFFWLAPALTMVPALLTLAVIPFGSELFGEKLVIADVSVGPLFIFAIASLSVYGITFAGWASNNKYSFFGGVRSCAQMISYEIALGLSVIPVLMIFGQLNLTNIVEWQAQHGWLLCPITFGGENGFDFGFYEFGGPLGILLLLPIFLSFFIFTVSIFAETNRMPFDLPECETELVGGYHTEYSSMKFALFFLGEYAAMIVGSALIVTLFFGGWSLGFGLDALLKDDTDNWVAYAGLIHLGAFLTKVIAFILFFILVRWTVPRFRYDQLMKLGWVVFFELALINILVAAVIMAAPNMVERGEIGALIVLIIGVIAFSIAMFVIAKSLDKKKAPQSL
ncbi:complex I subunit 1/NuoH family protein [Rubritalea profundi]|uniref:NADH-quinone oxidoreductase subunit H n=1 Tax=Rubritalea profundi TaxID=1658618 RepID=A0A2S7U3I8_9BACT|nr:complex I subunit 1 family protein [Rubritalea profundi]PQJ29586.1 hydroxyacid dehydrogenase [Rubritalea profundi]